MDQKDDDVYEDFRERFEAGYDRLFRWLDRGFHGMQSKESLQDQTYTFFSMELSMGKRVEIPIVVPYPGDCVEYTFSFVGEVRFGIFEVNEDEEFSAEGEIVDSETGSKIKVIRDISFYNSGEGEQGPSGKLDLDSDGVLIFVVENDETDWLGMTVPKSLSYQIQLHSHTFSFIYEERNALSRSVLTDMLSDRKATELRIEHKDDEIEGLEDEVEDIEEELEKLRAELQTRREDYSIELETAKMTSKQLQIDYFNFAGLFYRGLSSNLLRRILSFLPSDGIQILVCKKWFNICRPVQQNMKPSTGRHRQRIESGRGSGSAVVQDAPGGLEASSFRSPETELARLVAEKRKVKVLLESWDESFRRKNQGRAPTETEMRSFTKDLFERFAELNMKIKALTTGREKRA